MKKVPCRIVRAGQSAALSIGNPENITERIRKVIAKKFFF